MAPPLSGNKLKKLLVLFNVVFLLVGTFAGGLFVIDKWMKIKKRIPVAINKIVKPKIPNIITSEIINSLRKGGHTIFIRHSTKDSYYNLDAFDELSMFEDFEIPSDYFKAGCLNGIGKTEAWIIGESYRKLNIPVGMIYVSPTCRTRETAKLAFGRIDRVEENFFFHNFIKGTKESIANTKKMALKIINQPPAVGKNKIIIAHGGIISRLGWPNSYPQQSGMFIVKHMADQQLEVVVEIDLNLFVRAMRLELAGDK